MMRRRLTLTGSTLRPRSVEFKAMVADEIAKTVWPYVEGGRLKPVIDRGFPLAKPPRRTSGWKRASIRQDRAGGSVTSSMEKPMTERLMLHEYSPFGNCYKVRLTAALLGVQLERREYDIMKGETRTPDFSPTSTPMAAFPVLQVGDRFIPESNAACYYPGGGVEPDSDRSVRPRRHAALDVLGAV